MKIKRNNNRSNLPPFIRDFFKKKKYIVGGMLGVAVLMAFVLLFFGAMGYGAYIAKVAQYAYEKPIMLKVSELDFSFLKDYKNGQDSKMDEVDLNVDLKDLLDIQRLRDQALENGIIDQSIKEKSFPARLTYRGKTHNVRIELTGTLAMQWKDPSQYSLQIKAEGEDRIEGMKQFRLLLPASSGYLTDWFGLQMLKDRGLTGLYGDFVSLVINGKSKGVFYLEEDFDRDLALSGRFGEGVLFKIENDQVDIYHETQLLERTATKEQVLLLKKMWQDLKAGTLAPGQFFDLEKMGRLFVVVDFMNHKESLLLHNLSFRLNPQTGLAEPIARQFKSLNNSNHATFASFLEQPKRQNKWHAAVTQDPVMKMVYDDLDFKRAYIREAAALSPIEYVDNLLIRNGNKLDFLLNKVYQDWPAWDLPTQSLYGNQRYLQTAIYPDEAEMVAYLNGISNNRFSVYLQNQRDLPLEVVHLSWRDSVFFYPENAVLLSTDPQTEADQSQLVNFEIPQGFVWVDSLMHELKVTYHLLGLSVDKRTAMIYPWSYDQRQHFIGNPVVREANYKDFAFIKEGADQNTLFIPTGNWTVSKDLVIPKNKRLEIEPGTQIDIINNAKIFIHSPVFSNGTPEKPILIKSSDKTAQGIVIIRAGDRSLLSHTRFEYISCPVEDGWSLSGAVVFYESPVTINSTTFSGNLRGDDFLNIIRSDFLMDNTLFKDINADAFDCDFCTGKVINTSFVNIGNDGIDVSGSKIEVENVQMDGIGDKGLSAGENSQMEARSIVIRNAEIGATSKDRSWLYLSDIQLINARIGITLFMKKTEYGPAFASADKVTIEKSEIPYLVEDNSSLVLDGKPFVTNKDNVKSLLYGAEYGKASK